ncbi:MAG: glycosyl transferase, partial [Actinomycetota bacterium]
ALERLLGDTRLRAETAARVRETAEDFRWSRVLRPLLDFCQNPYRAADLLDADVAGALHQPLEIPEPAWGGVRGDLALVRRYVAEGGLPMAAGKALGRIRRLTRRSMP